MDGRSAISSCNASLVLRKASELASKAAISSAIAIRGLVPIRKYRARKIGQNFEPVPLLAGMGGSIWSPGRSFFMPRPARQAIAWLRIPLGLSSADSNAHSYGP